MALAGTYGFRPIIFYYSRSWVNSMLKINLIPEIRDKFKELLEEEDNGDAVIRIRETKIGGG